MQNYRVQKLIHTNTVSDRVILIESLNSGLNKYIRNTNYAIL